MTLRYERQHEPVDGPNTVSLQGADSDEVSRMNSRCGAGYTMRRYSTQLPILGKARL